MNETYIAGRRRIAIAVFEQARARGELVPDADLELLWQLAPATVVFRALLSGETVDRELTRRVVDNVVLPLALVSRPTEP